MHEQIETLRQQHSFRRGRMEEQSNAYEDTERELRQVSKRFEEQPVCAPHRRDAGVGHWHHPRGVRAWVACRATRQLRQAPALASQSWRPVSVRLWRFWRFWLRYQWAGK